MLKWIGRLFIAFVLIAMAALAIIFTNYPDILYKKTSGFIGTYRGGIDGEVLVKERGFWTTIERGIERRTAVIVRGGKNPLELYALRIIPKKVSIKVIAVSPKEIGISSISYLAEKTDAIAIVNASYFNTGLGILGLCLSGGKTVSPLARFSENQGIFAVRSSGEAGLIHKDRFNMSDVTDAIQSGPWLVQDGVVQSFDETDRVTRRSCIGVDKKGRIIIVATDTIFSGIKLADLAQVMAAPYGHGGFECVNALNLDGGTSTQLVLRSKGENHLIRGFVNVPVLIGVYRR